MKSLIRLNIVLLFAAAIVVLLFANTVSFAQNKGEGMKLFQDLRTDINSYVRSNVMQSLTDWKKDLDRAMKSEDLNKLNDLRSQAKDLRNQMETKMKARMEDRKNGNKVDKDSAKEEMKPYREKMQQLAKELRPLAAAYKSTLKQIGDQAKPKAEVWKKDIKDIVQKWRESHKTELNNLKKKPGFERYQKHLKQLQEQFGNPDRKRLVTRFMLWDGSDDFLNNNMGFMR